ncbi:MAG: bifunctional phosphopantothenoylcysteine decarboxylase/phosphopantothenate--cysteine ligase CoaBC [Betaproteobacteria bacterium]|nr:bifunctional phosphopantothenoylcysteine decarboxylase/phosphopantothenate--cysteine ligase CoaBC [Betaproteobacteria bacterium]
MTDLDGKCITLGVTGGVAAYKAAELVRLLGKAGARVRVVLTGAGARFVTPVTFQALSGNPVWTDLWDPRASNNMAHIELSRDADAIVVAPASADFLARIAHGLANDLLTTLCLARPRAGVEGAARDCPLLVAPAMNVQMWENPATRRNMDVLRQDGVVVLGPGSGDQACGETGMGRMLEPEELLDDIVAAFLPALLAGRRVLLTAGPTFEPLDPVRGLTNSSSGRMGYALARAAAEAGAQVTLVSGPVSLAAPRGVRRVDVTTAREMHAAVMERLAGQDVFIGVAAVADFRPAEFAVRKIKKGAARLTLDLVANPDILAEVAVRPDRPLCVGFAAESENLDAYAEAKRRAKGLPLVVGNLVHEALGREDSTVVLFDDAGRHPLPPGPKMEVARRIIAHIAAMMPRRAPV